MGNDSTIKTGSFTDPRDGQVYKTVTIGKLEWMAENFNYKTEDSQCYDNDESNGEKYGRLYTWDDAQAACPRAEGWRLPSEVEWGMLVVNKAGGRDTAGKKLKSEAGWNDREIADVSGVSIIGGKNGNGTDDYGFSALPCGECQGSCGNPSSVGDSGFWWSSREDFNNKAYAWSMDHNNDLVLERTHGKESKFSVRYVRDAK